MATQNATALIQSYAYTMDVKDFDFAASFFTPETEIDYSAVGGPKGKMTRQALAEFLSGLLGRADLGVHTLVGQVLAHPQKPEAILAYYAVKHFRGGESGQTTFAVYGWYDFSVEDDGIARLAIRVQAMEGDASILG